MRNFFGLKKFTTLFMLLTLAVTPAFAINAQANEFLRKARVQMTAGNLKAAESYLKQARKLDSDAPEIQTFELSLTEQINLHIEELIKQAFFAMQEKDIPKAQQLYQEVLVFQPDNPEANTQLQEIEKINKQLKEYRKQGIVIQTSSGGTSYDLGAYSSVSYYQRALAFFNNGQYEKALQMLNEILAREPNHRLALELKDEVERVLELSQMIEKAEKSMKGQSMELVIQTVTELLQKDPNQNQYYLMRAKAYMALGQYTSARIDYMTYYNRTKNREIAFPLLSEACSGAGNNLWALGFAYDKNQKEYTKPFGFLFTNYFRAYFWLNMLILVLLFVGLPVAFVYTWQIGENLFMKFSFAYLFKTMKCIFCIISGNIDKCLKDLVDIARDLNYPWLNYLTGLALLDNNEILKAQRFFKFSITDRNLRARGHYFHGLTGRILQQTAYDYDFEQCTLTILDDQPYNPWRPWFLKKIENHLLSRYEIPDNDSLESMAHKLLVSIS